jgi:electron transfer flavoprotein beta subunit
MGADDAVLVRNAGDIDSFGAARAISAFFKKGDYTLLLMGKQAIDSDRNQTAQMVAEMLELPQACFASKVVIEGNVARVDREVDGGIEQVTIPLPGVISTDLRLNEPRYAALPNIMKAKKKPLDTIKLGDLGVSAEARIVVVKMESPAGRKAGRKVGSVEELLTVLRDEARVL